MNYLPLKLQKLRKHYNYSQAYLANVLGMEVVDYMGYENGRNMLNYEQIKKLASLYHIDVIEILRNNEDVTLYDVAEADTDKINIEYFIPKKTLLMRAKEHPILSGIIAGLIIAVIVGTIFFIRYKNRPYVSYADNTDRLSVSDISVIYIDNLGAVKGSGDNGNGQISNLPSEHASKVVEGSNFSIILLDDGTVTSSGLIDSYQKEISKWKNIVDIAAGSNHIVGVDNNGRAYCIGDNAQGQCNITGLSNIKNVYATALGTIAIDNNGQANYSGQFIGIDILKKNNNIIDVDSSDDNLIILKQDGTCDYAATYDNTVYYNVLTWKNIIDVACGNDFFAGLKQDGTVVVASLSLKEDEIKTWSSILAIGAGNNYLIGFDGKEIKGVGKNDYHQFMSNETSLQTLPQVKNIIINATNDYIGVKFDPVTNAQEYEITLIIDSETKINKLVKANEEALFDTTSLLDNMLYDVSIVAKGDNKVYGDSLPSTSNFVFLKEIPEEKDVENEKIKIRTNLAGASKDDFENYLKGLGYDKEITAIRQDDHICDNGYEEVLEINGITPGATYSKSELNARDISYTYCKLDLESPIQEVGEENNEQTNLED